MSTARKAFLSASEFFTVHIFQRRTSQALGAEMNAFHSKWQDTLPLFQPLFPPAQPLPH